jgi:hypothetical protein
MHDRRLLESTALALALAVGVLVLQFWSMFRARSAPVVLRYVGAASTNGAWAAEPAFWVINRTDFSLTIMIEAIEVQTDRGWNNCYQIPFPNVIWFTNNEMVGILLPPRATRIGSVLWQRIPPPTNAV